MSIKQEEKHYTLEHIVQILSQQSDITLKGNSQHVVKGICTIQEGLPEHIAFLVNPLYKKYLSSTLAGAVILSPADAEECPTNAIISKNPHLTYAKIAKLFDTRTIPKSGIHPTAIIEETCVIDESASIGPRCVLGKGVKIGARVVLGPGCVIGDFTEIEEDTQLEVNVVIYHRIKIGKRVIIASGTVIGSDGFGFANERGVWHKVPQLGTVIIHDDVEIGANCTIDRGAIEDTVIQKGAKLDNLIQLGHNVRIGEHTAIAGCTGIAGSTTIGRYCIIGGHVGMAGHLKIGDQVAITGKTAVSKSILNPGVYSSGVGGIMTNLEWRKNSARLHRLDALLKRVKELEKILKVSSTNESEESEL